MVLRNYQANKPTSEHNKLSLNWEDPYKIIEVVGRRAYRLAHLDEKAIKNTWMLSIELNISTKNSCILTILIDYWNENTFPCLNTFYYFSYNIPFEHNWRHYFFLNNVLHFSRILSFKYPWITEHVTMWMTNNFSFFIYPRFGQSKTIGDCVILIDQIFLGDQLYSSWQSDDHL